MSCGGRGTFSSRLRGDDTITKDSARDCHASTGRLAEIPGQKLDARGASSGSRVAPWHAPTGGTHASCGRCWPRVGQKRREIYSSARKCRHTAAAVVVSGRRAVCRLRAGPRLRRDVRRLGSAAASLPGARRRPAGRHAAATAAASDRSRQGVAHAGHHVHGLRRRGGNGADISLRPAAAHHHGGRVDDDRARADAAPDRDQPVPARHLSRRPHPRGGRGAARARLQLSPLPARNARRQRPPRHLRLHRRHRPGAPRGRTLRRARGQPARAERRVVHAREPRRDEARVPASLCALPRQPHRRLQPGAAGDPADPGAAQSNRSNGRRADARRRQLGLLRARVPGARDGRAARRGARPADARQRRLHAHHVGPAAR